MKGGKLNIGTLLGGGIILLRRRPGAALVWMLIYLAAIAGVDLISRQILRTDPSGNASGLSYFLIALLVALVIPVLFTAALRAVVRPREAEFASLDAGMDELRVIGLILLFAVIYSIMAGITGLVLGPVRFALSSGSGSSTGSVVAMIVVTLIPLLLSGLLLAALSLAFPLALIRRRINLDEAWRLSEGHVWPLFLTYLILMMAMMALGLTVVAVTDWPYFAALFSGGANDGGLDAASLAHLLRVTGPVDAMTVLGWILNAAQAALGIVFMAGAMASAARALVPDQEGLTETFS